MSVGFALSTGPIRARYGRTLPALTGTAAMAVAAGYWLVTIGGTHAYWTALFPGLVLMGISGGLSQAPMFVAAATLAPERATTGSAVLNMSRQVGRTRRRAAGRAHRCERERGRLRPRVGRPGGAGAVAAGSLLLLRSRNTRA